MAEQDQGAAGEPAQHSAEEGLRTPRHIKVRLWIMMFLQYFIQGCYLPVVSIYLKDALGFDGGQVGVFGSALAVGPLAAPLVLGQLVDRYFDTRWALAFCHLCGGIIMFAIFKQTQFWPVVILGTCYSVLYVPSMMLSNSLTFAHLKNRTREFPFVRAFGTAGFVVPALFVEFYWLKGLEGEQLNHARSIVFLMSACGGITLAAFAPFLPKTPPQKATTTSYAPRAIWDMLRERSFLVLVLVTLVVAIVHKFYFVWNGPFLTHILRAGGVRGAYEQNISSIGQFAEVAVILGLGVSLTWFGFKRVMFVGILAYLLRCLVFAYAGSISGPFALTLGLVCAGQALHGFCFAGFLAAAFIFVDKVSPLDARGSLQNFYGTTVLGLGFFLGGLVAGGIGKFNESVIGTEKVYDWTAIWLSSAGIAAVALIAFAIFFPRQEEVSGLN